MMPKFLTGVAVPRKSNLSHLLLNEQFCNVIPDHIGVASARSSREDGPDILGAMGATEHGSAIAKVVLTDGGTGDSAVSSVHAKEESAGGQHFCGVIKTLIINIII
jgi:hypothetical protein